MLICSKCGKFVAEAVAPHECVVVEEEPKNREYLGDGVYARSDGSLICLTAENGIKATDTVYLEYEVWLALLGYGLRIGWLDAYHSRERSKP